MSRRASWTTPRAQKLWWAHWRVMWLRIGNYVRAYGGSCPAARLWPQNDNRQTEE